MKEREREREGERNFIIMFSDKTKIGKFILDAGGGQFSANENT